MKVLKIGIALSVLFLVGMAVSTRWQVREEEKSLQEKVLSGGKKLVSLLSLFPVTSFDDNRRALFFRTLIDTTSPDGLVYFVLHDDGTNKTLALIPHDEIGIPEDVETNAHLSMGLIQQSFIDRLSEKKIYEFAKPIFEDGKKAGTLRLGLQIPSVSFFSASRTSFIAMLAFVIFAAVTLVYYSFSIALRPLGRLQEEFKDTRVRSASLVSSSLKDGRIGPVLDSLERFLGELRSKIVELEQENVKLASKLGVIRFQKNQIMTILDSINFGILITDTQDNVTHMNDYMLNLLKKTPEEVIDRPLGEVLEHQEITSFIYQRETLNTRKNAGHVETVFPDRAPGEIFQVFCSSLTDMDKTVIGRTIWVKNVTADKAAEKSQHEFIAHVTHELLTPITNIKSYSEMLMDGEIEDGETQKEFYNTIHQETDRLRDLIQNLLNISKMEMGNLTVNKGLVKTEWFAEDCLSTIEASAQEKNISIEKKLPDNFPSLIADKELLKAAIINILGNALKYTPEKGTITFAITETPDAVAFEVMDTGCGIGEKDLPHIFEKFYRSADVSKTVGSGLGLAIASEIVHLHDGKIQVQSEPGKGSHFTIRIPKQEHYLGKT